MCIQSHRFIQFIVGKWSKSEMKGQANRSNGRMSGKRRKEKIYFSRKIAMRTTRERKGLEGTFIDSLVRRRFLSRVSNWLLELIPVSSSATIISAYRRLSRLFPESWLRTNQDKDASEPEKNRLFIYSCRVKNVLQHVEILSTVIYLSSKIIYFI